MDLIKGEGPMTVLQFPIQRQRVGNSIFYLNTTMKICSGDVIFRSSNVNKNATEEGPRRYTMRESLDADNFRGFQRYVGYFRLRC